MIKDDDNTVKLMQNGYLTCRTKIRGPGLLAINSIPLSLFESEFISQIFMKVAAYF